MCIRDSATADDVGQLAAGGEMTGVEPHHPLVFLLGNSMSCLLYTSDAADERSSVDLGGRRIIKKKKTKNTESAKRNNNQS